MPDIDGVRLVVTDNEGNTLGVIEGVLFGEFNSCAYADANGVLDADAVVDTIAVVHAELNRGVTAAVQLPAESSGTGNTISCCCVYMIGVFVTCTFKQQVRTRFMT